MARRSVALCGTLASGSILGPRTPLRSGYERRKCGYGVRSACQVIESGKELACVGRKHVQHWQDNRPAFGSVEHRESGAGRLLDQGRLRFRDAVAGVLQCRRCLPHAVGYLRGDAPAGGVDDGALHGPAWPAQGRGAAPARTTGPARWARP